VPSWALHGCSSSHAKACCRLEQPPSCGKTFFSSSLVLAFCHAGRRTCWALGEQGQQTFQVGAGGHAGKAGKSRATFFETSGLAYWLKTLENLYISKRSARAQNRVIATTLHALPRGASLLVLKTNVGGTRTASPRTRGCAAAHRTCHLASVLWQAVWISAMDSLGMERALCLMHHASCAALV